jgi:tetratricopeptide (TPR) repeat protein
MNKGVALDSLGQLAEALTCYDDAIAIYRQLVEDEGRRELAYGLATALMNQGSAQEQLEQWQDAVDSFNEGIGWRERLVQSGMEHLTPSLIKGLRIRFDLHRQLAVWEAAAADVVKALTYATPFLQSGSSPTPLAEELTGFRARLHDLADDERAQLYAALGEQAALVQEGMSLPPDPAKVTLASTAHPRANSARAAQLNMQYQQDLARWQALPWWKRLRVKKPTRPTGI